MRPTVLLRLLVFSGFVLRDGETGSRKRSNSAIKLEKLTRKLSERDDSLLEEELAEEIHEAMTIIEEPSFQKIKEGSKVEMVFKCVAQGNSKLTYHWYKDGTELQGRDEGSLVLKSVALPDFGQYKCVAGCKDSSHNVESLFAKLDVIPRDGTSWFTNMPNLEIFFGFVVLLSVALLD